MRAALCSVSFRDLPVDRVAELAAAAGLAAVEWGGDVHVRPADPVAAHRARAAGAAHALDVAAYGSYLRLGDGLRELDAVLDTATALGAPLVRVWAGTDPAAVTRDARIAVREASEYGLSVGVEHHVGTLTHSAATTASLMQSVPGLRTLWQPLPSTTHAERVAGLELLKPWLTHLHVFHWTDELERRPLEHVSAEWADYLAIARTARVAFAALEFVPGDSPASLPAEAETLLRLLGDGEPEGPHLEGGQLDC